MFRTVFATFSVTAKNFFHLKAEQESPNVVTTVSVSSTSNCFRAGDFNERNYCRTKTTSRFKLSSARRAAKARNGWPSR